MNAPPKGPGRKKNDTLRAVSFFSQVGITIVVCLLIGVFLGRFLDDILGTPPFMLLLFSLLGAAAAFKAMYEMLEKY